MSSPIVQAGSEAEVTLQRACEHLLSLQSQTGWWKAELETNVTMDAEDMLLREFLGIRRAEETARTAGWIRSQQRADGTWSNFHDGPPTSRPRSRPTWRCDSQATRREDEHMRLAAEYVRGAGGLQRARVFTHIWMALFGALALGPGPGAAAGDDPAARLVSAERLRLRLLGAADGGRAVGGAVPAPGAAVAVHAGRADGPEPWAPPRRPRERGRVAGAPRPAAAALRAPPARAAAPARAVAVPSAGSSTARRRTAAGAASSRPGCTR